MNKKAIDFDESKPKHSCKSQLFWKKMTLETKKDISCLKAFAFSIVFFSLATSILYCPIWPWAVQGSCPPYPTAFHSLRHGWQQRKKNRQTATGKGLLLSGWLCDISGDNHNKRQITARFTVSDKLAPRTPSHFPKNLCLQTRRDHATVWRQRARATRHLVTETAPASVCW